VTSLGRRAKRALETLAFRVFLTTVRGLPHDAAVRLGAGLGRFAFALGLRRKVAVRNVEERLAPEGGRHAAERIARESYEVAGRTFVHLLRADLLDDRSIWRLVSREAIETVSTFRDAAGTILVSGHFGNWELLVLAIRRAGIPTAAMAGDQSNAYVDTAIRAIRARAGVRPLSARSGLRDALGLLREGGCLATLMDQDARSKGIFVDFLGAPASAHVGIVTLAMRTGSSVVPGVLVDEHGRYRFVPGVAWRPRAGVSDEENARAGAEHFHRFLEAQVRQHPGNYFWAHRRWKTRPKEPREIVEEAGR
jgi:KDO2-lipid IV(A) lauroyltransferase